MRHRPGYIQYALTYPDRVASDRVQTSISELVARTMDRHAWVAHLTLDQILEADSWARREAGATN